MDELQAYVTLIKDIVTGLSAITAAIIAIQGLRAWKKQLKGKTEYELAQRLLRSTYKVREAIAHVRLMFIEPGEVQEAMKGTILDNNLGEKEKFAATQRAVYKMRWKEVQDAIVDLDSLSLEAETIWESEVIERLSPLRQCVRELYASVSMYLDSLTRTPRFGDLESIQKEQKMLYSYPGEEGNFFSDEIASAIRGIENFIKPHLKL